MNELFIFLARFQHKLKYFLRGLSVLLRFHLPAHGQKHLCLKDFKAPPHALTRFAVSEPGGHVLQLPRDVGHLLAGGIELPANQIHRVVQVEGVQHDLLDKVSIIAALALFDQR